MTYSLVAADPAAGEVGVAVQSRYFAVGAVVPWARAGVGAVATQAAGVAVYGPRVLELLAGGATPAQALEQVLAGDPERETRQLGVVSASGEAASFTGEACLDWAGGATRPGLAVQGNILAGPAVVEEMARAFEQAPGSLAQRLLAGLEAAQAAGGDRRGQQSAALLVERSGAAAESREGIDTVVDLRVDDHAAPVAELGRLLGIHRRWDTMRRAGGAVAAGDHERGIALAEQALREFPDDPLLLYTLACCESRAGRLEEALGHAGRAIDADPSLRADVAGDEDFAPLRGDSRFRALVGV